MTQIQTVKSSDDLKLLLAKQYQKQIVNFMGDEKRAMKFLSAVMGATQRTPKLLQCTPVSLINSFMTMAQLDLMPSDISGEAYVIPYNNNREKCTEAKFQLGYQGLVTLFYRSGVKQIRSEIVMENDEFSYVNGEVHHTQDVFSEDRGEPIGAYVIVSLNTGGSVNKVMSKKEILEIGAKFSKSFTDHNSPWKINNDPQLWMWKKTVLKQVAKLVPKNELVMRAIAEDNQDSNITDRMGEQGEAIKSELAMGHILKPYEENNEEADQNTTTEDPSDEQGSTGEDGQDVSGGAPELLVDGPVREQPDHVQDPLHQQGTIL